MRAVQRVALQVVILQPTQEERARVDQVVGDLSSAEVGVRVRVRVWVGDLSSAEVGRGGG